MCWNISMVWFFVKQSQKSEFSGWKIYHDSVDRLIKMCLNETYSKVCIGKYLSDNFPIQNGRGMHIGYWWESQKERDHWKDRVVGGWTMLKWILER
jgi:RimJ/RimL family protein N-acetyltransferase